MIRACTVGRRELSSYSSTCDRWLRYNYIKDDKAAAESATVLVSTSSDVFLNLALEDWMYKKFDWTLRPPTLLLWRNRPCIVIGRHQNPWLECRLSGVTSRGLSLARRNSGGGAVFHDLGNLNCTFFTSRAVYDRKANLELICKALTNCRSELDVRVSSRLDILLDDHYKVSGTASKLGRDMAYHHCTVLVDVDTALLSRVLRTSDVAGVQSKSTRSVKSPVRNLGGLYMEDVVRSIANLFSLQQQQEQQCSLVEPTEQQFPGITEIARHLRSWEWIFGKCPPFTLERTVRMPTEFDGRDDETEDDGGFLFKASISKGIVESASVNRHRDLNSLLQSLVGCRFSKESFDDWTTTSRDMKNWIAVSCFADLF